jgi:hypothetical protein
VSGVRLYHPDLDDEISVPESAVPFHRSAGWQLVADDTPVPDGLDGLTVPQLRIELASRQQSTAGLKPELLARLRGEPEQQDEEQEDQDPAETEAAEHDEEGEQ